MQHPFQGSDDWQNQCYILLKIIYDCILSIKIFIHIMLHQSKISQKSDLLYTLGIILFGLELVCSFNCVEGNDYFLTA